jgi:hypothetical protein
MSGWLNCTPFGDVSVMISVLSRQWVRVTGTAAFALLVPVGGGAEMGARHVERIPVTGHVTPAQRIRGAK